MLSFILFFCTLVMGVFAFGTTTGSPAVNGQTGYAALTPAVRDFYSREVLFQAQPRLRFLQFAKIKRDLVAAKGKSIVFVKYANLTGGGALEEYDTLVPVGMGASEVSISIKEQGNSVELTERLLKTALLDTLGDASKLLAINMATVLDSQLRDTCLSTTNVVYGNGAASLAAMDATSVFSTKVVKDAIETLASNNAPRIEGDYYVCIASPHQLRQLRDDPAWINANTYMGRRQLYRGEVGMYEGCIFIETNQMPTLDATAIAAKYGSGATITTGYEAVFLGENAFGLGIAMDVEMRDGGIKELGRKHEIGWYGMWGSGIIENKNLVKALTA